MSVLQFSVYEGRSNVRVGLVSTWVQQFETEIQTHFYFRKWT